MSRRLALGLALFLAAACSSAAQPPAAGENLPPVEAPSAHYAAEPARHAGGTVTVGLWQFPTTLSPIFDGQAAAVPIEQGLFDGLVGLDSSLDWYGDLARDVPTLANGGVKPVGAGMDVHFVLRPGLTWSDGQPITAADVAWTWQAIVGPANTTGASAEGYDQITAIDPEGDSGLVMHYDTVYPAYLDLFGTILPRHRLAATDPALLAQDAYWGSPDVVSGPFTVKEAVADDHVTLVRNPAYAAGRQGSAHLERVVFRALPTKQAVLAAAKAGDVQVGTGLDERDLATIAGLSGVRARLLPALQYEQVSFNQADPNPATGLAPPWAGDPQLLEALDLALDRPALFAGPLHSRSPAAITPISPLLAWAHDGSLPAPRRDLARARSLLDADGWKAGADGVRVKAGRRLSFALSTSSDQPLRATEEDVLVAGWKQAGVEVKIHNFPTSQLLAGADANGVLATGAYDAALWAWITPPDPDVEFDIFHSTRIPPAGSNYTRCHDRALDQALTAGRASLDQPTRAAAYHAFEQAYQRVRCELPLYQRLDISVVRPGLHNFAPNPSAVGNTWNLADWWLGS